MTNAVTITAPEGVPFIRIERDSTLRSTRCSAPTPTRTL